MKHFERILTIISILVAILNLYFAFPSLIKPDFEIIDFDAMNLNLATRAVALIILELSLASAFGLIFKLLTKYYLSSEDFFPSWVISISIVALISAWISVFNIEYFLIRRDLSGFWEYLGFFILIIAAYLIAFIFIQQHILNLVKMMQNEFMKISFPILSGEARIRKDKIKDYYYNEYEDTFKELLPVVIQGIAFVIMFICIIIDS